MRNYAQYIANAALPNINASHQDVFKHRNTEICILFKTFD